MDHSPQDSLSMGFSRQDYGSGLPFPSPGDLPDPGIKHASLKSLALQTGSFPQVLSAKPLISGYKALYAKCQSHQMLIKSNCVMTFNPVHYLVSTF